MCCWGGHQRSPLQTYSEIDLTQNPIKVIVTGDITVSAELDGIGLTIGEYTYGCLLYTSDAADEL